MARLDRYANALIDASCRSTGSSSSSACALAPAPKDDFGSRRTGLLGCRHGRIASRPLGNCDPKKYRKQQDPGVSYGQNDEEFEHDASLFGAVSGWFCPGVKPYRLCIGSKQRIHRCCGVRPSAVVIVSRFGHVGMCFVFILCDSKLLTPRRGPPLA